MLSKHRNRGFSLLEILVVVAIISILAALAYPSYQHKIQRTHAAAAKQYLLELSSLQNEFIFQHQRYASTLDQLGTQPGTQVSDYYAVAIIDLDNTARPPIYTLQAKPKSGSTQASAAVLTLNHLGQSNEGWHEQ